MLTKQSLIRRDTVSCWDLHTGQWEGVITAVSLRGLSLLDAVASWAVQELGVVSTAGGTTSSARAVCKLGNTAKGLP